MKKKIEYYVVGGQYEYYTITGATTLTGAKRLAKKNAEYWDNWQGWHIPEVYKAEDMERIDGADGYGVINALKPKRNARPVTKWNKYANAWTTPEDDD